MAEVSIIVPAYNAEKTMERCLKSLASQTFNDIEIILVDDGSSDNTSQIVRKLQKEDSRVQYIYQENKGVSVARNTGITFSKGNWIVFCDSDDYVDNNYIELMVKSRIKYTSDWVIAGYRKRIGEREYIYNRPFGDITCCIGMESFVSDWYKNQYIAGPCSKLYDAHIIKENNLFFPEGVNHGEDTIFNINYCAYCDKVSFVKKATYIYLDQEESLCKQFKDDIWKNQNIIYDNFNSMCMSKGFSKQVTDSFFVRGITLSLNHLASQKSDIRVWKKMCRDIIGKETFQRLNVKDIQLDTFGKMVINLLKYKRVRVLKILFDLKLFIYSKMKTLYFSVRR